MSLRFGVTLKICWPEAAFSKAGSFSYIIVPYVGFPERRSLEYILSKMQTLMPEYYDRRKNNSNEVKRQALQITKRNATQRFDNCLLLFHFIYWLKVTFHKAIAFCCVDRNSSILRIYIVFSRPFSSVTAFMRVLNYKIG